MAQGEKRPKRRRVESVATRLIVDREREIENFIPEEYWTVDAKLKTQAGEEFEASLNSCDGKKLKPEKEPEVKAILDELAQQEFVVDNVKKGEKKRNPAPPFTTSTLQQEA